VPGDDRRGEGDRVHLFVDWRAGWLILVGMSLPPDLTLGAVDLAVTDLDRSVGFYRDSLGLDVNRREDPVAAMGVDGQDLVVLTEVPRARRPGRTAGLYHFALLHPSRRELARALRRLAVTGTPIQGAADHGVSEAIYLPDPDANGIELYSDRPRDQWPPPESPGDKIGMYTIGLDLDSLLATTGDEDVMPRSDPGLVMGHLHLHVGDLARGNAFYRDVVGFDEMVNFGGTAEFVSAGGYHHHLGYNVWRGEGVPAPPPDTIGLRRWTVVLPERSDVDAVRERAEAAGLPVEERDGGVLLRDPWEIPLLVRPRAA
jgi:catechol 2,3-dioxygenase